MTYRFTILTVTFSLVASLIGFIFLFSVIFTGQPSWVVRLSGGISLPDNSYSDYYQKTPFSDTLLNPVSAYTGKDIAGYFWNNIAAECYTMGSGWNDISPQSPSVFLGWSSPNNTLFYSEIPGWLTSVLPVRTTLAVAWVIIAAASFVTLVVISVNRKKVDITHYYLTYYMLLQNTLVQSVGLIVAFALMGGTNFQTYVVLFCWPALVQLLIYRCKTTLMSLKEDEKSSVTCGYYANFVANGSFLIGSSSIVLFLFLVLKLYDYTRQVQIATLNPNFYAGVNGLSQGYVWVFAILFLIDMVFSIFMLALVYKKIALRTTLKVESGKIISEASLNFLSTLSFFSTSNRIEGDVLMVKCASIFVNAAFFFICTFLAYAATKLDAGILCSFPQPVVVI